MNKFLLPLFEQELTLIFTTVWHYIKPLFLNINARPFCRLVFIYCCMYFLCSFQEIDMANATEQIEVLI